MNYCTKCGNKLEQNSNFCTNCGTRIKKESNPLKPLLILGIILVLFSSFVLGLFSWDNMSSELKIGFFVFETILFFVLGFILKKAKSKLNRLFYIIGLVLVPYTLSLVGYYDILSNYFHFDSLLNIYLAIIFFITFILYILVNIKFKSNFVNVLSLISLLISFINIGFIFNKNIPVIVLLIIGYTLLIYLLSFIKKINNSMKSTLSIVSSIIIYIMFPVLLYSILVFSFDNLFMILNLVSLSIYTLITYIKLYTGKTLLFKITSPFILLSLLSSIGISIFSTKLDIIYYFISSVSIILYLLSLISKDNVYRSISLVLAYLTLFFILLLTVEEEFLRFTALIVSSLICLLNIFNIIVTKYKKMHLLLPLSIFLLILNASNYVHKLDFIYVALSVEFIYLIIYNILKIRNSSKSLIYLVSSLVLSSIATFEIKSDLSIINLITLLSSFIIFVLSILYKEDKTIRIISYVFFNLGTLLMFDDFYNSVLLISGLTILFGTLLIKYTKINLKPYILYSEILVFLITLFNTMNHNNLALFIGIIIFLASYMTVIKFFNNKFYRIPYIMIGLLTIIRIISVLIEPIVIASIISIASILIILTIIYLLDIENKWSIYVLTLIVLIPYYNLINAVFSNIYELYVIPFIVYDLVLLEMINFKDNNTRNALGIISLSLLSFIMVILNSDITSIFINVLISLSYIFIGLFKKYNHYIYLGIVYMAVTLYSKLFEIIDSAILMIFLIIVGFTLIIIALVKEIGKKQ